MTPYKNEIPRASSHASRDKGTNFYRYSTSPDVFSLAPLLPPSDAPPIPEEYWLIHRYRKGGQR